MAYWYAPVLAGWHGLSPAKALFFSFVACVRNWRAFLVYSLAILVVATLVPGLMLGVLAALLPSGAALLTVLMTVLLILVLAPTLFASFYVSYRDVFVSADDDA
jgi:ABC-type transport system involved in multi-copper enzyme maturation permease subunit